MAAEATITRASPRAFRLFVILLLAINPTVQEAWKATLFSLMGLIDDVGILNTVICLLAGVVFSDTWNPTCTRALEYYRQRRERRAIQRLGILPDKPVNRDVKSAMFVSVVNMLGEPDHPRSKQQDSLNICAKCLQRKVLCGPWLSACIYLESYLGGASESRHLVFDPDMRLCGENLGVWLIRGVISDILKEQKQPAEAPASSVHPSQSSDDFERKAYVRHFDWDEVLCEVVHDFPGGAANESSPENEHPCPSPSSQTCSWSSPSVPDNVRRITDDLAKPETEDRSQSHKRIEPIKLAAGVRHPYTDEDSMSQRQGLTSGSLSDMYGNGKSGMAYAGERYLSMGLKPNDHNPFAPSNYKYSNAYTVGARTKFMDLDAVAASPLVYNQDQVLVSSNAITVDHTPTSQKRRRQKRRANLSAARLGKSVEEFETEIKALRRLDGVDRDQAVKMLDLHNGDFFKAWDDARQRYGSRAKVKEEARGARLQDSKAKDIELVMAQVSGTDALKAVNALAENGMDVVDAIMALSF